MPAINAFQWCIYRCCRMNSCRWMNVNIADDNARWLRLFLVVCSGASVHFEEMPVRVNRRTGRFYLWPPIVHRQRKQFPGTGQSRQHFTFPFDVALITIVSVAVRHVARIARMEDGRNPRKYVQRANVDSTIDECRHIRTRLFHIMINGTCLWIDHQTTVVNGLLFRCFCAHYRYLNRSEIDKKRNRNDKSAMYFIRWMRFSLFNAPRPLHFSIDGIRTILWAESLSKHRRSVQKMP